MYATPADLNAAPWNANISEPEASTLIARAGVLIDTLTKTATYSVDSDGLPTESLIVAAFNDATCAQASYFLETGDVSGAAGRFNTLSLGSFSASGGTAGSVTNQTSAVQRYAPEAVEILLNAGLIGRAPRL